MPRIKFVQQWVDKSTCSVQRRTEVSAVSTTLADSWRRGIPKSVFL